LAPLGSVTRARAGGARVWVALGQAAGARQPGPSPAESGRAPRRTPAAAAASALRGGICPAPPGFCLEQKCHLQTFRRFLRTTPWCFCQHTGAAVSTASGVAVGVCRDEGCARACCARGRASRAGASQLLEGLLPTQASYIAQQNLFCTGGQ